MSNNNGVFWQGVVGRGRFEGEKKNRIIFQFRLRHLELKDLCKSYNIGEEAGEYQGVNGSGGNG